MGFTPSSGCALAIASAINLQYPPLRAPAAVIESPKNAIVSPFFSGESLPASASMPDASFATASLPAVSVRAAISKAQNVNEVFIAESPGKSRWELHEGDHTIANP